MEIKIDEIDSKIITCLQKDGRMSFKDLAKTTSLSEVTVRARVKKLLDAEVFQIVAVCAPQKVGLAIEGHMQIKVRPDTIRYVIEELDKIKEIWNIAQATGNVDISIEFHTGSLESLSELINSKINKIDGITSTETTIMMKREKLRYDWGTRLIN